MKGLKPEHRQYTIKHVPGRHLDLYERIILARDWNAAIEANSASLTIRSFAKAHGLAPQTWQRELNRGAEGKIVRHLKKAIAGHTLATRRSTHKNPWIKAMRTKALPCA